MLSYYEFYKNASIETNYYIKDLSNNAVCERAEAYQSTARSRIFLVFHISVEHDEKPPHTKFDMNRFMVAKDIAA